MVRIRTAVFSFVIYSCDMIGSVMKEYVLRLGALFFPELHSSLSVIFKIYVCSILSFILMSLYIEYPEYCRISLWKIYIPE